MALQRFAGGAMGAHASTAQRPGRVVGLGDAEARGRLVAGILADDAALARECDRLLQGLGAGRMSPEELRLATQCLIDRLGCRQPETLERVSAVYSGFAHRSDGLSALELRGYVACVLTQLQRELDCACPAELAGSSAPVEPEAETPEPLSDLQRLSLELSGLQASLAHIGRPCAEGLGAPVPGLGEPRALEPRSLDASRSCALAGCSASCGRGQGPGVCVSQVQHKRAARASGVAVDPGNSYAREFSSATRETPPRWELGEYGTPTTHGSLEMPQESLCDGGSESWRREATTRVVSVGGVPTAEPLSPPFVGTEVAEPRPTPGAGGVPAESVPCTWHEPPERVWRDTASLGHRINSAEPAEEGAQYGAGTGAAPGECAPTSGSVQRSPWPTEGGHAGERHALRDRASVPALFREPRLEEVQDLLELEGLVAEVALAGRGFVEKRLCLDAAARRLHLLEADAAVPAVLFGVPGFALQDLRRVVHRGSPKDPSAPALSLEFGEGFLPIRLGDASVTRGFLRVLLASRHDLEIIEQ